IGSAFRAKGRSCRLRNLAFARAFKAASNSRSLAADQVLKSAQSRQNMLVLFMSTGGFRSLVELNITAALAAIGRLRRCRFLLMMPARRARNINPAFRFLVVMRCNQKRHFMPRTRDMSLFQMNVRAALPAIGRLNGFRLPL